MRTKLRESSGRMRRAVAGLLDCRRGATAVEVALIMPPFILMTFGIIEVALLYFVAAGLEGQVGIASRQIRTGNVQQSGDPIAEFRTLLCGGLNNLIDCDRVIIDVRDFGSFGSVTYPDYYNEDGEPAGNQFSPGNAGRIVLVRVAYQHQIYTPFLGTLLGDSGGQTKLINASAIFRNEPYQGVIN